MSNFDADAEPDGWRADIILRDRKDRPVVVRANATFELMPRVVMPQSLGFVDADMTPVRWSMPLEFDEDSVARIKLPLRKSLRPVFGWQSAIYPPSSTRSRNDGRKHPRFQPPANLRQLRSAKCRRNAEPRGIEGCGYRFPPRECWRRSRRCECDPQSWLTQSGRIDKVKSITSRRLPGPQKVRAVFFVCFQAFAPNHRRSL